MSRAATVNDPPPPAAVVETGATAPLVTVAYSPDGSQIYSLDNMGKLLVRDAQSGAIRFSGNVDGAAMNLHVLADGSLLVGLSTGAAIRYAKPAAGKPLATRTAFNLEEAQQQLAANPPKFMQLQWGAWAVSPDEKWLALETIETANPGEGAAATPRRRGQSGVKTARIRLWNLESGALGKELAPISADKGTPRLAWGDAGTLVVVSPEVALQRFDALSGEMKSEWSPPAELATKADPVADAAEAERRLKMLPEAMQDRIRNRPMRPGAAGAEALPSFGTVLGISSDGNWILAATRYNLQVWDVQSNSNRVLENSEKAPKGGEATFSTDNATVALRAGSAFWLWHGDGTQAGTARIPFFKFSDLSFAPGAKNVVLSDEVGVTRIWNIATPLSDTAQTILPGYFEPWTQLSASPKNLMAATGHGVASLNAAGKWQWFPNIPLESPAELPGLIKTQTQQKIIAMEAAPDGESWAESIIFDPYMGTMSNLGIPHGELRARDAQTGKILWHISDNNTTRTLNLIRFLADGTLVTGKEGFSVSLVPQDESLSGLQARDGKTGEGKTLDIAWGTRIGLSQPGGIQIIEPSANGKILAISGGSGGGGMQIVDMEQKSVKGFFSANSQLPRGPWATSADGKWLAGVISTGIGVWDISQIVPDSSSKPTVLLKIDNMPRANALAFGANGGLAVGLADGRVLSWLPEFSADSKPAWETITGRAIRSLSYSADGKTLWTGDERGELKARDAQTGELQSTLRLLAPRTVDGAPEWVKWNRAGKVEKSSG